MSNSIIIRPQTQHKKTTYQVEWYEGGKRKRKNKKTRAEANAYKQLLENKFAQQKAIADLQEVGIKLALPGPVDSLVRKDIQSALEDFYESKKAVAFDPKDLRSLKIEKIAYNYFGEFIIDSKQRTYVDEITLKDLEEYRAFLQKKGLKNATVARKETSMTSFLNYCVSHKYRSDNPATGLAQLPIVTPKRPTMRETDYREQLEDGLPEWCSEIFIVQGETFGRNIELLRARIGDVNLLSREIRLISAKGSHVHERWVPLTARAFSILKAVIAKRKLEGHGEDTDYLFLNSRGNPVTSDVYCDVIKETRRKLEIPEWVKAYVLRHDGLKNLRRNKVHQSQIGEIAGHRKLETTLMYLTSESDELRNVINLVDEQMKRKASNG